MVGTWLKNFSLLCPTRKIPGTVYNKTTITAFGIYYSLLNVSLSELLTVSLNKP